GRRDLHDGRRSDADDERAGTDAEPGCRGSDRAERQNRESRRLMAVSIVMPALEMAQDTGKLIAWRKKEGEPVTKGEALLEIETDKAVVEIEAPADGVLAGIKASEGTEIPVGQTIAWIVAPGERPPTERTPSVPARPRRPP